MVDSLDAFCFHRRDSRVKHNWFSSYCLPICLDVNCGLSLMKRSRIYVLHGGKVVVGYGSCPSVVCYTVFWYLCWTTAGRDLSTCSQLSFARVSFDTHCVAIPVRFTLLAIILFLGTLHCFAWKLERYWCCLHDIIVGNDYQVLKQHCNNLLDDDQLYLLLAFFDRTYRYSINVIDDLIFPMFSYFQIVNCPTL
jgi:hypothetical protein